MVERFMKHQRGETIVEVLLSVVMLAAVISGSYYIANRSSRLGQQSIERAEAVKLLETQIEYIRWARGNDVALWNQIEARSPGTAGSFCLLPPVGDPTGIPAVEPTGPSTRCGQSGNSARYNVAVYVCPTSPICSSSIDGTFGLAATWEGIGEAVDQQAEIITRVR